jgi:hypothetical protein
MPAWTQSWMRSSDKAWHISLIQVGQLLLIRQGAYDKVGVFYDASASAYQMGQMHDCKKREPNGSRSKTSGQNRNQAKVAGGRRKTVTEALASDTALVTLS